MGAATLDIILPQLHSCTQSKPNQWQSLCPAHKETDPSFGVTLLPDGRILLNCFRGCSKGDVLAALNVTLADLAPDTGGGDKKPRQSKKKAAKLPPEEWERRSKIYAEQFSDSKKSCTRLATALALPESVFDLFEEVGVRPDGDHPEGPCWTFPERDENHRIIGFSVRLFDHKKRSEKDGERGLLIPVGWQDRPGALYLPEGVTDVLALTAAGLAAVGRASVSINPDILIGFINKHVPKGRQIVWIGENDQKPNGDWPGLKSRGLAVRLAAATGRPIHFALSPGTEKDPRAWLTKLVGDGCQWDEVGQRFVECIKPELIEPPPQTGTVPAGDDRQPIHLLPGCNEYSVNDRVANIVSRDPELFVRSSRLVTVVYTPLEMMKKIKFPPAPMIVQLGAATLRERISRMVKFTSETKSGSERPVSTPDWCTNAVLVRNQWNEMRYLQAVVEYPFLRPDGSLVSDPGYDDATGVYLYPHGIKPIMPTVIDRDAALKAWEQLQEVVVDFPFQHEHHRSTWLCGLLTPLARFVFDGPTPLFLVDGNTPGSGKGLLCNLASIILTGQDFPTVPYSHEDEEMRKKITSFAMRGVKGVMFDNIAGNFGGSIIDAMLTSTVWEDRMLGSNTVVTFPLLMTSWATGNNVQIAGDGLRRIGHIRMDSQHQRPEERTGFKHEKVKEWTLANRERLLGCALTILIAYFRAGRPAQKLIPWGSYEGWSETIRAAVVWLGLPDPAEGKRELRQASDPIAAAMETILCQWEQLDRENSGITTNKIISSVFPPRQGEPPDHLVDIGEAISSICVRLTGQQLATRFRQFRGRILGEQIVDGKKIRSGRRLNQISVSGRVVRWGVFDENNKLIRFSRSSAKHEDGEDSENMAASAASDSANADNTKLDFFQTQSGEHPHYPHHPHQNGTSGMAFSDFDT